MAKTMISVARDFSKYPAGRFRQDGKFTGEAFREDFLLPALKKGDVEVDLDGTLGYGSSFLEEAFGGLVREHSMSPSDLHAHLTLKGGTKSVRREIWNYIEGRYQG